MLKALDARGVPAWQRLSQALLLIWGLFSMFARLLVLLHLFLLGEAFALIQTKELSFPVRVTEAYQSVFHEDERGDPVHRWYESEMARNEGFAVLLKYKAFAAQVKVTEYIEMAGPAVWELQHYQQCEVANEGRQITCTMMRDNTGTYYSQWLLREDDPVGPVKMIVTIGDAEPKEFNFSVEERINLFAK